MPWNEPCQEPATERLPVASPSLPKVSIHLPVCNEPPALVKRTLDALSRLDYPDFEVLVIDSNTSDPALWEPVAEYCARLGPRFRFFLLGPWPGGRAGALRFALAEAAADAAWIAVLDNGSLVRPDWLRCVAPLCTDPAVGLVRSMQDHRATLLHPCITLVRRSAMDQAGGWASWAVTAETELTLRLAGQGWREVRSTTGFGCRVGSGGFAAAERERTRHARGAGQICRVYGPALLSPVTHAMPLQQRWRVVADGLPWLLDALCAAFLVASLGWSVGLILGAQQADFPMLPVMLLPVALLGGRVMQLAIQSRAQPPGRRFGASLAELGLVSASGRAAWGGLWAPDAQDTAGRRPSQETPIRTELTLLLLAWGAVAGVGLCCGLATPGARLWCLVLLIQSLPNLAALVTARVALRLDLG